MSLQWRHYLDGELSEWNDHTSEVLRIKPPTWPADYVEIREKPSFEPGYYQQLTRAGEPVEHGFVSWWSHEPDLGIWKRVEVADVS